MTIQRIYCPNGSCAVETRDDENRIIDITTFADGDNAWSAMGLLLNVLMSTTNSPVTILPDERAVAK